MDISKFSDNIPGKLIEISNGQIAFQPDDLPPAWEFPDALWPLLSRAKEKIALLEGIGRSLPDPGIILRPMEDRESIHSSRLEGTHATPKELFLFEMNPESTAINEQDANRWREVLNYKQALRSGVDSNLPLCLRLIRDLHRCLMMGVRGQERTPGEFRELQVAIGENSRFVPPPPDKLSACLHNLEQYINTNTKFDPLVDCFISHYQFETIHPFLDGNGRVGRLLLSMMIQQKCQHTKPWIFMSEYFDLHKKDYARKLFEVSAKSNWKAWIEFCLKGTIETAEKTITRCENLRQLREDFLKRLSGIKGSLRLNKIVESLFHSPVVQIANLARKLGVSYPTMKNDVDRLVNVGILSEFPGWMSAKSFIASEILPAVYSGLDDDS